MDVALFVASAAASRLYHSSLFGKKKRAKLTLQLLKQQNAETSTAIIEHYAHSPLFARLAQYEGHLTVQRDNQDASKLQLGIQFAQNKGVIDPNFVPEPYVPIDVLGYTPDQVAKRILQNVMRTTADAADHADTDTTTAAVIIVLVGLSGTGKGTTLAALKQQLQQQGKKVTTWSNGNIFRSVTLLAITWCAQNNKNKNCPTRHNDNGDNNGDDVVLDAETVLTKQNLQSFMSMLSFGLNPHTGLYDTHIHGLGLDYYVSQIQNTLLKSPAVSPHIPTVAQYTQGEVIQFAASAVQTLSRNGITVLLEGREATVNYVRTPHRFCLRLSSSSSNDNNNDNDKSLIIGQRRAAQRLAGQALLQEECRLLPEPHDNNKEKKDTTNDNNDIGVIAALDAALETMVLEM